MKKNAKIALITGGSSGIGRATAKEFAKVGYDLIITGRRKNRLNEVKAKLEYKYGVDIKVLVFDIRSKKACEQAYNSIPKEWKNKIDILINNAGGAKGLDPIQSGNTDHWDTMIDTNIKGLLYMTRLVTPKFIENQKGHVINICSTAGHEVYPNGGVYCATKHAVDALTKGLRFDLHKEKIRVSQVSPAAVEETEFAINRFDGDKEKAKIYDQFNPLTSKDVAKSILFIAQQPKHVNIQDIIMLGSQQASSTVVHKSGRIYDKVKK